MVQSLAHRTCSSLLTPLSFNSLYEGVIGLETDQRTIGFRVYLGFRGWLNIVDVDRL